MVILETGRGAHWLIYGIFSRTVSFTLYGQGLAGFFVAHCEDCGAGVCRCSQDIRRCLQVFAGNANFCAVFAVSAVCLFCFLAHYWHCEHSQGVSPLLTELARYLPPLVCPPGSSRSGKKRIIWHVFNEGGAPALCASKFKLTGTHGQIYRRSKARIRQGYPMRF